MIYYVDIDNTICETKTENGVSDYVNAKPLKKNIEKINDLYDIGHIVVYWTARGATTGTNWKSLTQFQLDYWGAKHHRLEIGTKPAFDVLIDDKAVKIEDLI